MHHREINLVESMRATNKEIVEPIFLYLVQLVIHAYIILM